MSLVFYETNNDGTFGLWDSICVNAALTPASGITGMPPYCLDFTNDNGVWGYSGGSAVRAPLLTRPDYYFSFLWRPTQLNFLDLIGICDNNNVALEILTWNDGRIAAYKQNNQLSLPGTVCWAANTTYRVEVYFKIAASGGRVILKIGGTTIIDYTGNTSISGTDTINKFWIGRCTQAWFSNHSFAYFGDIAVSPDGWIGTPNKSMVINARNQKLNRMSSDKIVRI